MNRLKKYQPMYILTPFFTLLITLLTFMTPLYSQVPAPAQERPLAFVNGTIHTVSNGVVEGGTVLVEMGKIVAVGESIEIPSNAEIVDLDGRHLFPGLIDAWSEMGLFEIGQVSMTVDLNEQGSVNPNVRAEAAFNPESRHIGVARSAGVLATVSTPAGGLISGKSAAMMLDGWTWQEMVIRPGAGLVINWPSTNNENSYGNSLKYLREFFADSRAYRSARVAMGEGSALAFDIRMEAMIPVLEQNVPVVVQADEVRQIQDAISWSQEEGLRIVILGGRDSHYILNHLSRHRIPVIVTSVLDSPNRDWEPYDSRYSLPAKLYDAGVKFAIAGASDAAYANRLPWEAGAAVAFGLPLDEALKAVTISPAEILGFEDRLGTIEPRKDATLLITTGHPLEYDTEILQAYIEGRKIDMRDAHLQFYEKYREKVDQRQGTPR
ncbi:MAG: amidohydrolase family protein [Balneolaceae bacterium]